MPDEKANGPVRGFATLAETVARQLSAPEKLAFPQSIGETFARRGIGRREFRRLFGRDCETTTRALAQARKFVFAEDFSQLVRDTAAQDPATIERIFATARAPYATCWIEWDRSPPEGVPGDQLRRWGVLVLPSTVGDEPDVLWLLVVRSEPSGRPMILPAGVRLSFDRPVIERRDEIETDVWLAFGHDYFERWARRQFEPMSRVAEHIGCVVGLPPFSGLVDMYGGEEGLEREKAASEILQITGVLAAGAVREIICSFALIATHIGGSPLADQVTATAPRHYYGGRFHPSYEYRILRLVRPMTAPRLVRRVFPKAPPQPTRWHEVIGAWHHRRAPTPLCGVHPRACARAQWQKIFDQDGEPVGSDLQACSICSRHRWFIADHARGDPSLGTVEKDYEVTASSQVAGHA
jgi:hypothetical protein